MALINCPECGKEISNKAKACPSCGMPIKVKGKGFAVASLVLGIIACVYSLPILAEIITFFSRQDKVSAEEKFAMIAMAVYIMVLAILSLIFGIVSHVNGCKLKKKTAGIILSSISIVCLLVSIIVSIAM